MKKRTDKVSPPPYFTLFSDNSREAGAEEIKGRIASKLFPIIRD